MLNKITRQLIYRRILKSWVCFITHNVTYPINCVKEFLLLSLNSFSFVISISHTRHSTRELFSVKQNVGRVNFAPARVIAQRTDLSSASLQHTRDKLVSRNMLIRRLSSPFFCSFDIRHIHRMKLEKGMTQKNVFRQTFPTPPSLPQSTFIKLHFNMNYNTFVPIWWLGCFFLFFCSSSCIKKASWKYFASLLGLSLKQLTVDVMRWLIQSQNFSL